MMLIQKMLNIRYLLYAVPGADIRYQYYGSAKRFIRIIQFIQAKRFIRIILSCTNIPVAYFISVTISYCYIAKKENYPIPPDESLGLEIHPEESVGRIHDP